MRRAKPGNLFWVLAIAFTALCCSATTAIAQTARKFVRHDVVEVGNGRKAEILQCRGEGPLEECDVIYYTINRAQGHRMWQNANRLREEERAAKLLNDIKAGKINSLARTPVHETKADVEKIKAAAEQLVSEPPPVRGSKLIDSSAVGSNVGKDTHLKTVVRRIDSVNKDKIDTFQVTLKRELELQRLTGKCQQGK